MSSNIEDVSKCLTFDETRNMMFLNLLDNDTVGYARRNGSDDEHFNIINNWDSYITKINDIKYCELYMYIDLSAYFSIYNTKANLTIFNKLPNNTVSLIIRCYPASWLNSLIGNLNNLPSSLRQLSIRFTYDYTIKKKPTIKDVISYDDALILDAICENSKFPNNCIFYIFSIDTTYFLYKNNKIDISLNEVLYG